MRRTARIRSSYPCRDSKHWVRRLCIWPITRRLSRRQSAIALTIWVLFPRRSRVRKMTAEACLASLLMATERIAGRYPASHIASASAMSLCRLTNGFTKADGIRGSGARRAPVRRWRAPRSARWRRLRSPPGIDADWQKRRNPHTSEFPSKTTAPDELAPWAWKTFLAKSRPTVVKFIHGCPLRVAFNTRQFWHKQAMGHPRPPLEDRDLSRRPATTT